MSEHFPHIRAIIAWLRERGATDVHVESGGKHPRIAFVWQERSCTYPVAGSPRNVDAAITKMKQQLVREFGIGRDGASASADNVPVVKLQDGEVWADSRDVASCFGKNHKDVLRTIREMHCSEEFRRRNFAPFKIKDLAGESTSHVMMNKNGFVFLVMGFTGEEAGKWKEAYIAQFDQMERELAQIAQLGPDLIELIRRTDGISRMLSGKVTGIESSLSHLLNWQAELSGQVSDLVVAHDRRRAGVINVPALQIAKDKKVPQKGRRPLVTRIGNSLNRWCRQRGLLVISDPRDVRLFPVEAIEPWLRDCGALIIKKHIDSLNGQGELPGMQDGKIVDLAKRRAKKKPDGEAA